MKTVYIAGPYSNGDQGVNVRRAIDLGDALLRMGYAPYIPHLTHFWNLIHPGEYEMWMELDFAWLSKSDFVLRIPGYSNGVDREVELAIELGIPVFTSVNMLMEATRP